MPRTPLIPLIALTALALLACDEAPSAPPGQAPQAAAPAEAAPHPARAALAAAVGDSAPLTVLVDPARWAALHAALTARIRGLPPGVTQALQRLRTPAAAVGLALGLSLPEALPGLDPDRPWAFALFEPPADGPVGATTALLPSPLQGFPGFRHRAALPARDAAALLDGLAAHLAPLGYTRQGPIPGRAGSQRLQGAGRWIAAWPGEGHLYVEWVSHQALRPGAAPLEPVGPLGTPAQGAAWIAAQHPAALSARVEGRHLRALFTAHGHGQAASALASVADQAIAPTLERTATELLFKSEPLMGDDGVDVNAHALTLDAVGGGLRLVWSAEVTQAGQRALAAGERGAAAPLTVKGAPLAQATAALGWGAALDAAAVPSAFARVGASPRALAGALAGCGVGCWAHFALRAPFASAAGALQVLGALPGGLSRPDLPSLVQVVAPGPAQIAVAAEIGAVDPALIRRALAEVPALAEAQLHVLPRGDRKVALLGVGVDPRTVFELTPAPAVGLGQARVDLAALAGAAPAAPGELAALAAGLGPLTLSARLHPWGVQQVLDLGAAQPRPLPDPPAASPGPPRRVQAVRCPSCGPPAPNAAAPPACATKLARGIAGLSALARGAPATQAELADRVLADLEPGLECVGAAAPARALAAGARRILKPAKATAPPAPSRSGPPSAAAAAQGAPRPPSPAGSRGEAAIQRVLRRHQRRLRACYERQLRKDPTLEGELVLRLTIAPDGRVAAAKVDGGEGPLAAVSKCVVRRADAMRFPAGPEPTTISHSLGFRVKD